MPLWGLFVQKKCKNAICYLQNGRHFPRPRSFEVIFPDKVPFTPNNAPTECHLDNQNSFGERCKKVFFQLTKPPLCRHGLRGVLCAIVCPLIFLIPVMDLQMIIKKNISDVGQKGVIQDGVQDGHLISNITPSGSVMILVSLPRFFVSSNPPELFSV